LLMILAAAACEATEQQASDPGSASQVAYDAAGGPEGLPRYRRWSDRIGQGGQPEGDIAFKNLKALGYETILTVDGSVPDVETAKKYGLTYVHVPIGYDGIPREEALKIVKAAEMCKKPVYVHCHHGRHRGPAAAMLARMAVEGVTNENAVKGLELSGTSPKYSGLWKCVREFQVPTDAELSKIKKLPSSVRPEGLRGMMVDVAHRFTFLKASKMEEWKTPKDHPDVSPPHEARMLWENYREIVRLDEAKKHGKEFLRLANEGEKHATSLEEALRAKNFERAGQAYKKLKKNCDSCHADYRN